MEEKREWGAAALCHRERDTEKQPWSIRLNIDEHAATITATLGIRKKMNSVCVQSFLYASEDKPLRPWMKKRNTTSHRQKDIGVKGMFPEKTHWNLCKRQLKNHGEQRIDSKLILNCSVIKEVSRLCLSGLNAAADRYRAFSSFFFPLQGMLTYIPMAMVIPAPLRKPCHPSLRYTEVLGEWWWVTKASNSEDWPKAVPHKPGSLEPRQCHKSGWRSRSPTHQGGQNPP